MASYGDDDASCSMSDPGDIDDGQVPSPSHAEPKNFLSTGRASDEESDEESEDDSNDVGFDGAEGLAEQEGAGNGRGLANSQLGDDDAEGPAEGTARAQLQDNQYFTTAGRKSLGIPASDVLRQHPDWTLKVKSRKELGELKNPDATAENWPPGDTIPEKCIKVLGGVREKGESRRICWSLTAEVEGREGSSDDKYSTMELPMGAHPRDLGWWGCVCACVRVLTHAVYTLLPLCSQRRQRPSLTTCRTTPSGASLRS
jgi:hypothetical protein